MAALSRLEERADDADKRAMQWIPVITDLKGQATSLEKESDRARQAIHEARNLLAGLMAREELRGRGAT